MKITNNKTISIITTITIIAITLIINTTIIAAQQGHMTLLTVAESGNKTYGGTADLYLEIRQGNGRIFIDSFPLTKADTQISTRYAQQIACDFLEMDCSDKDFFYTIRAKSNIVGGPSASGPMSVLTVALLANLNMNEDIVMTGTINSGGIIGPVAGIEKKTEAAQKKGFKKILIPKWSIINSEKNSSLNLTNNSTNITTKPNITYAENFTKEGIQVTPITTLEEAIYEFTGKQYNNYGEELVIPEQYQKIMKEVAIKLCDRTEKIETALTNEVNKTILNETKEQINNSKTALENQDFYSAASYCFSANTKLRTMQYENYTNESKDLIILDIKEKTQELLEKLETKQLRTISDLETYIIVKERLTETQELLNENKTNTHTNIGYTTERFYSAIAWSSFFEYQGKEVNLEEKYLETACINKIAEAEERQEYLEILFGKIFTDEKELTQIKEIHEKKEYEFCLFRASKYKADLNAILSTIALTEEKMPELIKDKLKIAKQQIIKQKNKFPILGYSYYNYANSLEETEPNLALLFAEYSVELSNLDMYFPKKKQINIRIDEDRLQTFSIGVIIGIIITLLINSGLKKIKTKKK
ncbi:hypothetical protein K9L67_01360 [Candidatus Woesearchaeota archaeon]|nr:hypothetical protein [Candidatus Woesearchaeota archaeon]MCF7900852.1 hypothetical protein [Candidatus Woesearchaeota archaeon]MCF8013826.1 hypothetical protein [Candidatus Woesearchaeota archaeon]